MIPVLHLRQPLPLAVSNYISLLQIASLRVVQPVWRFAGHTKDGATFEVLIQAVRDEYLQ